MKQPVLLVFAGLPGAGKTTIARTLAQRLGAVYLRVDTIEQSLRSSGEEHRRRVQARQSDIEGLEPSKMASGHFARIE